MENNCSVLQTDNHDHVSQVSPLETKFKEIQQQVKETEPQEKMQELQNNIRRHNAHARPLGGIGK